MITGELNIREVDVDGQPEEPGDYLLFINGGGAYVSELMVQDLESFDDCFDGIAWWFNGEYITGYVPITEFEELM